MLECNMKQLILNILSCLSMMVLCTAETTRSGNNPTIIANHSPDLHLSQTNTVTGTPVSNPSVVLDSTAALDV